MLGMNFRRFVWFLGVRDRVTEWQNDFRDVEQPKKNYMSARKKKLYQLRKRSYRLLFG